VFKPVSQKMSSLGLRLLFMLSLKLGNVNWTDKDSLITFIVQI